jgi:hypothetical protein
MHHAPVARNQQLVGVGVVVVALLGAYYLGQVIVAENFRQLAVVLIFSLGGLSTFFILREWRLGVVLFFVWAVFEDLLRKYLGNNMLVYAVKDVVAAAAYLGFLLAVAQRKEALVKNPLRVPLLAFVAWVAIETLNPYLENYLVPVLGLRMSLFYLPMLFLGASFFATEEHMRKFWFLMLGVAAFIGALGIIQSFAGLDFLNPTSAPHLRLYLTRYAPESGSAVPRPTATFVDAGRFAQYMLVMAYVGLGVVAYFYNTPAAKRRLARFLAWACWMVILAGLFLSGQRSAIILVVLSLIGMFAVWLVLRESHRSKSVRPFPFGKVLLAGTVVLVITVMVMPDRFEAAYRFYVETIDPRASSEVSRRPQAHVRSTIFALEQSGWIGHGTGSSSLGLQYVAPLLPEEEAYKFRDQVEGGYAVVVWEWGIVGLVLWLWWSLQLLKIMVRTVWGLRETRFFWLSGTIALCIFAVLFPNFLTGMQIYQNYLTQAFLWFLIGMLLRLPKFVLEEDAALRTAPAPVAGFRPSPGGVLGFRPVRWR